MADFDIGSGLKTVTGAASSVLSSASSVLNTASKLGSALSTGLSNPSKLLSAIRSINLPLGGEAIGSIINASATFGGTDNTNDWRVRLSMPTGSFFDNSPILKPLWDAGGLVFPYNPTISITGSANYTSMPVTHQNYPFQAYQNSQPSDIQISGEFYVEDAVQAKYWLATVHFLRSVTKMFTGDSAYQGNPPPILNFSAYGDHVFRNVPVVVKSFSLSLPKDAQYISTNVANNSGNSLSSISNTANQFAGIANATGNGNVARSISEIGSAFQSASTLTNMFSGIAGGQGAPRDSHVPVKSDISVTLMPIYSREAVRKFSLQQFVNGSYVSRGYI